MSDWAELPLVQNNDTAHHPHHMEAETTARLVDEIRDLRLKNIELKANLELTRRKLALYKNYETELEASLASIIASAFDADQQSPSATIVSPDVSSEVSPNHTKSRLDTTEAIETALIRERNRIAQSIHDGLSQQLTGIVLELEACQRLVGSNLPQAETRLIKAIRAARSALADVRNYMFSLRTPSPSQLGLIPSLERLVADFEQRNVVPARLRVFGNIKELSQNAEEALLRVAQEALTNISKHAQARQVELSLRFGPSSLELCIFDDGVGFDVKRACDRARGDDRLGLIGMQERLTAEGGFLSIDSSPGMGTRVVAQLPLNNHAAERQPPQRWPE